MGQGVFPPLLQWLNPAGSNNAVQGLGAPLFEGASKDILNQPVTTGSYVLTTTNKLTVLQATITTKENVNFTLPQTPEERLKTNLTPEKLSRAEKMQAICTLVFKGYDPDVYPSVQFMLACAKRLAELTDGIIADPLAETYRMPDEFLLPQRLDPRIDFREVCSVKAYSLSDGIWVSTRGLIKFDQPEFEMYGIPRNLEDVAVRMLISAGQQVLIGIPMMPNQTAFSTVSPLEIVPGTRQKEFWGDRPVLEFRDVGGSGAAKGVEAWARETG
ncbi:MAG TPA: hypothetical protein VNK96_03760 [Fimbriimonadales bacterium]|nr:hypothetical protein [Fimbriimonadales bacterium]